MLDAEAAIAWPMCSRHAVVDGQQDRVGAVADRVDRDLQSRGVGIADPATHVLLGVLHEAAVARGIAVGLDEVRGAGPGRTIHVSLESGDLHPVVPGRGVAHGLGDGTPGVERQVEGGTQREPSRALEPAVAREVGPRGRHVRRGGHSQRSGEGQRAGERRIPLLGRRLRDRPTDGVEGPVLEDPERLAGPGVAEDLAPRRRGRVLRHASGAHGGGVGERLVAVQATEEGRIVRRDRVDPFVARQRLATPQGVVPIAADDPLTGLECLGVLLDSVDEFLWRPRVAQVHRCELEPAVHEMRVAVREARQYQAAVGLNRFGLGTPIPRDLGRVADREDLPARERDVALLGRPAREARPHHAAGDDHVGLRRAGGERQAAECRAQSWSHEFCQRSLAMRWMVSSAPIGSDPAVFPLPGSAEADAGSDASASRTSSSTSSNSCSR